MTSLVTCRNSGEISWWLVTRKFSIDGHGFAVGDILQHMCHTYIPHEAGYMIILKCERLSCKLKVGGSARRDMYHTSGGSGWYFHLPPENMVEIRAIQSVVPEALALVILSL